MNEQVSRARSFLIVVISICSLALCLGVSKSVSAQGLPEDFLGGEIATPTPTPEVTPTLTPTPEPTLAPTPAPTPCRPPPPPPSGCVLYDLNGDEAVTFDDVALVANNNGMACAAYSNGDVDGDGDVDVDDALIIMMNQGPCPSSCPLFRIEVEVVADEELYPGGRGTGHDPAFTQWGAGVSCLVDMVDDVFTPCHSDPASMGWAGQYAAPHFMDDCTAMNFLENFEGSLPYHDLLNTRHGWQRTTYQSGNERYTRRWYYYVDQNCDLVTEGFNTPPEYCHGDIEMLMSPISLIWSSKADIEGQVSITNFPLDPNRGDKSYVWKASAETPLLVYDPAHAGQITSGAQLFGNWTFGGRRLAMAGSSAPIGFEKTQWKNGFEALESLDENGDQKLSGRELEPIGLWFDNDRDGVSDRGEVRSLADERVTALFFAPDYTDSISGSVHALKGFERQVDGKIVAGAAVDWYGEVGDSQITLLNKQLARSSLCGSPNLAKDSVEALPPEAKPNDVSPANDEQPSVDEDRPSAAEKQGNFLHELSGLWFWRPIEIQGEAVDPPTLGGLLALRVDDKNKVHGISFVEHALKKTTQARSLITTFALKGDLAQAADGGEELYFEGQGRHATVMTHAHLEANGVLHGETVAEVYLHGAQPDEKPVSYRYTWEARRPLAQQASGALNKPRTLLSSREKGSTSKSDRISK